MAWPFDLLGTPSQHDIAWSWVTAILPSDTSSPYGAALGTFASTMTFLASLLLGFHIVVGIVQSAYHGKVLGEKYHQIWAPLRVVIGFGLLIPLASGFSSAHYGLRDLVVLPGTNQGNMIWVTYADEVAMNETPIIARPSGGSKLVLDILEHEICAAVTNAAGNIWGFSQPVPPANGEEVGAGLFFGSNDRVQWNYGQDCGRLSFGLISDRPNFSATRRTAVGQIVSAVRAQAGVYADLFKRQDTTLSPDQAMAGVIGGALPVGLAQKIREMGTAYDAAIAQAAKADVAEVATESRSRLVEAARQDGWINAGAYWYGLAQISELTNALTGEQAEQVAVRYGEGNTGFERNVRAAIDTLRYQIAGEEARVGLTANDLAAAGDESSSFISRALAPLTRGIGEWLASRDETADPIARMISDGHAMMNTASSVIIGTGIAMGLTAIMSRTMPSSTFHRWVKSKPPSRSAFHHASRKFATRRAWPLLFSTAIFTRRARASLPSFVNCSAAVSAPSGGIEAKSSVVQTFIAILPLTMGLSALSGTVAGPLGRRPGRCPGFRVKLLASRRRS